jgi:23S rRNA (cytidine1920-2'-O)/16S rRNA (cytidine1409-2'-O)-methyltransferase
LKLVHALEHYGLDPTGAVALDIGSSTGGFTDVLLAKGAVRVYAIDVGRGQLAWRLRQDPRVEVREGVNSRYLTADDVPELVDWLVADVSFISLTLALPAALSRLKPGGQLVALIKPQFELSPRDIEKGGVVRDPQRRQQAIDRITDWLSGLDLHGCRFALQGTVASPILGPAGNQEFLLVASLTPN